MALHKETELIINKLELLKDLKDYFPSNRSVIKNIQENKIDLFLSLLRSDWINRVVGYYLNHRYSLPYAKLDDEYKIQDLIFILANSIFPDLHFENPQSKNLGALTSTRIDFSSKKKFLFIEIKHAFDKHQAKKIEREISEDIIKYGKGKKFKNLIFFIYCYNYHFPNAKDFEKNFTSEEIISGHKIKTYCIIKP